MTEAKGRAIQRAQRETAIGRNGRRRGMFM